jgi:hypothetical protein
MSKIIEELDWIYTNLLKMGRLFEERRTDVSDMCFALVEGRDIDKHQVESRFPTARFGEMEVQYDTLTTQFSVRDLNDEDPGMWIPIPPQAHDYPDDGQPKTIGEL